MIVVVAAVSRKTAFSCQASRGRAPRGLGVSWRKDDAAETHEQALKREIREELGAEVDVQRLVLQTTHEYPDRTIASTFTGAADRHAAPAAGQQIDGAAP